MSCEKHGVTGYCSQCAKEWFDAAARERIEALEAALREARRGHHVSDDCWYSCPLSGECCADDTPKDACNCGADAHNAKIDAALSGGGAT